MHLPKELIERKNELMLALRREMNGAVAGSMRDGGIEYSLNFGVSVPTIRAIAARYAGDDELAAEVWKSGVRELRLAALFIATPGLLTAEWWVAMVENYELAENYVWSLSRGEKELKEVVGRLKGSERLLDRYILLLGYARRYSLFAAEEIEEACRAAEGSGEPSLRRVAENLRICIEE